MEKLYQHILLAIDLSDNVPKLIAKALKLADVFKAKISILHVVEFSPAANHIFVDQQEYKKINLEVIHKKLKSLGVFNQINEDDLMIEFGSVKNTILDIAEKLDCDLIIVGSHGRHGIQLLLGSTANAVLHAATRDVSVIRFKK